MSADPLKIAEVSLAAPRAVLGELDAFYGGALGLDREASADRLAVRIGDGRLVLSAGEGEPFYHLAFLIRRARFEAAHAWLGARTELLASAASGSTVFEFDFWNARACYCHDPAGNILEVIGHEEGDGTTTAGPFAGTELLGISEVGMVTPDPVLAARRLEEDLGVALWSGELPGLGFVGRKAHTLILVPVGRGWLPTGRRAEAHPTAVTLSGVQPGEVRIPGAPQLLVRGTG